jgi:Uma2 family endonuclease
VQGAREGEQLALAMVITTSPLVRTYTLQEFWDLPETGDRSKLELIRGVLYMTPPPSESHDEAFGNLVRELLRALDGCNYKGTVYSARAALWIDDDTYLEPDLIYVSDELKKEMKPQHRTRADIVVEIISPSNATYDRRTKSDTYRAMGVQELWLMDTEARDIEVRSFEAGRIAIYPITDTLRSEVLPRIEIPVSALFP